MRDFSLLILTNKNPIFYQIMGDKLANKEIADQLDRPMWDEDNKVWFILLSTEKAEFMGCSAIKFDFNQDKAYFKSGYVKPAFRNNGLYSFLIERGLKYIKNNYNC